MEEEGEEGIDQSAIAKVLLDTCPITTTPQRKERERERERKRERKFLLLLQILHVMKPLT